ncbi:MAG: hypothetical protein ACTS7I_02065 [Candidatus Hodgkinia cicadicola]
MLIAPWRKVHRTVWTEMRRERINSKTNGAIKLTTLAGLFAKTCLIKIELNPAKRITIHWRSFIAKLLPSAVDRRSSHAEVKQRPSDYHYDRSSRRESSYIRAQAW